MDQQEDKTNFLIQWTTRFNGFNKFNTDLYISFPHTSLSYRHIPPNLHSVMLQQSQTANVSSGEVAS